MSTSGKMIYNSQEPFGTFSIHNLSDDYKNNGQKKGSIELNKKALSQP